MVETAERESGAAEKFHLSFTLISVSASGKMLLLLLLLRQRQKMQLIMLWVRDVRCNAKQPASAEADGMVMPGAAVFWIEGGSDQPHTAGRTSVVAMGAYERRHSNLFISASVTLWTCVCRWATTETGVVGMGSDPLAPSDLPSTKLRRQWLKTKPTKFHSLRIRARSFSPFTSLGAASIADTMR